MRSFLHTFAACIIICPALVTVPAAEQAAESNLYDPSADRPIVAFVPDEASSLEQYAIEELGKHVEKVTGCRPEVVAASNAGQLDGSNAIILGQVTNNPLLRSMADGGVFRPNAAEQGFTIRIAKHPQKSTAGTWLVVLCGVDPHGALYAVRDFSHYYFYKDGGRVMLRPTEVSFAPVIKQRQLSESGCNLFSAENPHKDFMYDPRLNRDTRSAVFSKHHYIDWLSEWKINTITLLWCNYPVYDKAYANVVRYAHSRGIQVAACFCPFVTLHEKLASDKNSMDMDCPRNPRNREWYLRRIVELVTREPLVDGICIETPEHDGHYCNCAECKKNPYPGIKMLNEFVVEVRKYRPDLPIRFSLKEPTPTPEAARAVAARLIELTGPTDFYSNNWPSWEDRAQWHGLGPKYTSYLRPFRLRLRGKKPFAEEVGGVFFDFRLAAEQGVLGYGFCYRFYGGKYGSYTVDKDDDIRRKYPDRKGPFSLALLGEASFDPSVKGEALAKKVHRIYELTIPDYPSESRKPTEADFKALSSWNAID